MKIPLKKRILATIAAVLVPILLEYFRNSQYSLTNHFYQLLELQRSLENEPAAANKFLKNHKESLNKGRPVLILPGMASISLELWRSRAPFYKFRQSVWGNVGMLISRVADERSWLRLLALQNGGDSPHCALRPATGLSSSDYVFPGVWVWQKILHNLGKLNYDPNSLQIVSYDWRLGLKELQSRDRFFTRLTYEIRLLHALNKRKVVVLSHSLGAVTFAAFLEYVEKCEPGFVDRYVHAWICLAAPLLGSHKSISGLVSGESRSTSSLFEGSLQALFMSCATRKKLLNTWDSIRNLLPKGGSVIWGDDPAFSVEEKRFSLEEVVFKLINHIPIENEKTNINNNENNCKSNNENKQNVNNNENNSKLNNENNYQNNCESNNENNNQHNVNNSKFNMNNNVNNKNVNSTKSNINEYLRNENKQSNNDNNSNNNQHTTFISDSEDFLLTAAFTSYLSSLYQKLNQYKVFYFLTQNITNFYKFILTYLLEKYQLLRIRLFLFCDSLIIKLTSFKSNLRSKYENKLMFLRFSILQNEIDKFFTFKKLRSNINNEIKEYKNEENENKDDKFDRTKDVENEDNKNKYDNVEDEKSDLDNRNDKNGSKTINYNHSTEAHKIDRKLQNYEHSNTKRMNFTHNSSQNSPCADKIDFNKIFDQNRLKFLLKMINTDKTILNHIKTNTRTRKSIITYLKSENFSPLNLNLPKATNFTIYSLYGTDLETEIGYLYKENMVINKITNKLYKNGIKINNGDGTVCAISCAYLTYKYWKVKNNNGVKTITREYKNVINFKKYFRLNEYSCEHTNIMGNVDVIYDILKICHDLNVVDEVSLDTKKQCDEIEKRRLEAEKNGIDWTHI